MDVNDLIDDYLNYILLEKGLSKETKESYEFDLISFKTYFENYDIREINEKDITNYLAYLSTEKKLSSRSIERHLTTLRGFYKYLVKMEKIDNDIT